MQTVYDSLLSMMANDEVKEAVAKLNSRKAGTGEELTVRFIRKNVFFLR